VLGKYQYEADGLAKGECRLRIVSGINVDEDLGKWKCVARLQGRTSEGYDYATLKAESMLTANQLKSLNTQSNKTQTKDGENHSKKRLEYSCLEYSFWKTFLRRYIQISNA
jgi:hypothetical protein